MAHERQTSDLSASVTDFSIALYKLTSSGDSGASLFVSPSSVYVVLAMLHAGARNKTLAEMTSALQLSQAGEKHLYDDIETFFEKLLKGSSSVILSCANKIYPNADKSILETYQLLIKKHFGTGVQPMNFRGEADKCRLEINRWAEEQTRGKIRDLLPSGSVTSDTGMVLVNAIYFKGEWLTPFERFSTRKQDFFKSKNKTNQVDMMHKEFSDVQYGESSSLDCQVLEIFYKGRGHGMVILLPKDGEGLGTLESKLNGETLKTAMSNAFRETVIVTLPKFKLESSFTLKPLLAKLGIPSAFDPATADFTGMGNELYVSEVFHKTFVDVNEEGTEAAAATAAVMLLGCALGKREIRFTADHPFLFMIWDHNVEAPLFIGRYTGPS